MLKDSNLLFVLLAIAPALLYTLIFYYHLPKNLIVNKHRFLKYLLYGILSPVIILVFQYTFPNWSNFITRHGEFMSVVILSFIQISFLEELIKMIFVNFTHQIDSISTSSKVEFFFYSALISTGFSISENLLYLISFGPQIIATRAITATLAHFTFGIMMSYFITLAKIKNIKKYWILALFVPTFAHGVYDLNLFLGEKLPLIYNPAYSTIFLVIILQILVVVSNKMIKHIVSLDDDTTTD